MCLNGRWRGFASATKRLVTSMTDPGRADCARQLLETTACWSASQLQEEWTPATTCFVKNCSQWSPRSYCCPETSSKQETAKKLCCVRQGPQPWAAENVIFQMNRQLSSIPRAANIVDDPQGPVCTHGSPRRESNLEVERLWFGVTSNTEVPGRSVRWTVTLIVPNINRFLPPSTFPTTRGVRFFNRMELLAIPQVPLRRSRSLRDGQHSLRLQVETGLFIIKQLRNKPHTHQ